MRYAARTDSNPEIGSLRRPPEGDWPPVLPGDNKAWNKALTWLEKSHSHLLITLGTLEETELDRRIGRNSLRENLLGTLQHYAYHAGQIMVAKKSLRRNTR